MEKVEIEIGKMSDLPEFLEKLAKHHKDNKKAQEIFGKEKLDDFIDGFVKFMEEKSETKIVDYKKPKFIIGEPIVVMVERGSPLYTKVESITNDDNTGEIIYNYNNTTGSGIREYYVRPVNFEETQIYFTK